MLLFSVYYMVCVFAWWRTCTHRMTYTRSICKAWYMHINCTHASLQLNMYVRMHTVTHITTSSYHPIHTIRLHQPQPIPTASYTLTRQHVTSIHTATPHLPNHPTSHPASHSYSTLTYRSDIEGQPTTQATRHSAKQSTTTPYLHTFT